MTLLQRLLEEDALGQLHRREGRMAQLGSESGVPKLDWIDGVARLLAHPEWLESVENEARALWERGIRHIIWAGMGGSIMAVRVLVEMGLGGGNDESFVTLHSLDSTDPAALNAIVRTLAKDKNFLPPASQPDTTYLQTLLQDVMMIGVSMGMTSEEPITHLEWFTALLQQARLQPAQHLLIMTLPDSYLDKFAQQYSVPTRPLQLDGGTGTGGRMSAPTTRVFLLPAALYLTRLASGSLHHVLQQAWQYAPLATAQPAEDPFVRLAAELSTASKDGVCRLLLKMPQQWRPLIQWIEQLMEESLGKGNKGIVVFPEQPLNTQASDYNSDALLTVQVLADQSDTPQQTNTFSLYQPYLAGPEPQEQLTALAASFLGWQLTMALYGYLHDIQFAGQPAVENYKARARLLRAGGDPLQVLPHQQAISIQQSLTLFAPQPVSMQQTSAELFASALSQSAQRLGYLDCTFNGVANPSIQDVLQSHISFLGNDLLGIPVKLRQAPAAYHSTEQSEMDGPPFFVSLRILVRSHERSLLGTYDDTFLRAQAVGTWQAMVEQGRQCYLLLVDDTKEEVARLLEQFFKDVETHMH